MTVCYYDLLICALVVPQSAEVCRAIIHFKIVLPSVVLYCFIIWQSAGAHKDNDMREVMTQHSRLPGLLNLIFTQYSTVLIWFNLLD